MTEHDINSIKICALNDALRLSGVGGKIFMTRGVGALPDQTRDKVIEAVRVFDAFTEDNDPYGEHDCAVIEVDGQKFIWKIDYYDKSLQFGSKDASNPSVTTRVLTIMLSSEY